MEIYRDSMNTKAVSHLDARLMLPRTATQFIHVNMSLGELMGFVSQRIDRQIQHNRQVGQFCYKQQHILRKRENADTRLPF